MSNTPATPKQKLEALEKMVVARISLLIDSPFFGNIATRLILENNETLPTAATDGRRIYFNPFFVMKLRQGEVIFLCCHELFHLIYDHQGRRGDRNPILWNCACDYAVNLEIVQQKIGEMITTIDILYDTKYTGMAAEEIYEDLLKNAKKINIHGLAGKLLDKHLDPSNNGEDGTEPLTTEERAQISDEVKETVLSAASAVGIGNVPAGIRRIIGNLVEPTMDWREVLRQQVESQVKSDFTYMRPSRRGWSCDAILPSMKREPAVECFVMIDLSGSIGEKECRIFMSELVGIMQQHSSFTVDVACFDTKVYNHATFTEDNFEDVYSYELTGCGGTDFDCIWRYLEDESIAPKQLVVLTDLECYTFGNPDYCPTLWLVNNKRKGLVAPHGTTVYFDN